MNKDQIKRAEKFLNDVISKKVVYERKANDFKIALIGPHKSKVEDLENYFCSEFVVECLQAIRLMTEDISSNSFLPLHFGHGKVTFSQIEKFKNKAVEDKLIREEDKEAFVENKNSILFYPFIFLTEEVIRM